MKNLIVVLSSDKDMTARDVLASLRRRSEQGEYRESFTLAPLLKNQAFLLFLHYFFPV